MKNQMTNYKYRLQKIFHTHQAFVVIVGVLLVLVAVFIRINTLSNIPMDQTYFNTESAKIKPVSFNEDAIDQIKQLNDSNVTDPGTQLPNNRQNPFSE